MSEERRAAIGGLCALGAFLTWGLNPIYFKAVAEVPVTELLAHRIAWCLLLLLVVVVAGRRLPRLIADLRPRRTRLLLLASTALISVNWFVFIYSVLRERILESSLGYFLNPLVNVLLGTLFLGERLRRGQLVAVALAATGVAGLIVDHGRLPWITLALAFSFGFYGLVRKVAHVDAIGGLFVECSLVVLPCVAWIGWLEARGEGFFLAGDPKTTLLLPVAGLVTAVPLVLFAAAAKRLTLTAVGFFQYLAPSCQLLLAVFVYGESFTSAHAAAFGCIWIALAVFTTESLGHRRRRLAGAPGVPKPP